MKFGFGIFSRVDRWPQRWRRPASTLSRALRPLITYWMRKKRKKIASAPKIAGQTPVVCIGNLVFGGSGKSPLVMGLLYDSRTQGFVLIVSRGFGGFVSNLPIEVTENRASHRSDEPLMLKIQDVL